MSGRISFCSRRGRLQSPLTAPTAPAGPVSRAPGSFLSRPGLRPPGHILPDGEGSRFSGTCRPALWPSLEALRPRAHARRRRGQESTPGSAAPLASAASSAPSRPREAVAAVWKRPAATPAFPYAAPGVASGAATPLGPRRALAPFLHAVRGQCSCSRPRPVRSTLSEGGLCSSPPAVGTVTEDTGA